MQFNSGSRRCSGGRLLVLVVALIANVLALSSLALADVSSLEVVDGEYLVKVAKPSTFNKSFSKSASNSSIFVKRVLDSVAVVQKSNQSKTRSAKFSRFVAYDPNDTTCQEIMASGEFEYCEPNFKVHVATVPNDPAFNSVWGLSSSTGIDAPSAWAKTTGSSDVVVAVIDTGIDYTHADLAANVWTNPVEIAGNGIDDDGNGYIDDVHGINASSGTGNPMDDNGHGTHVSGTIGAVGNNGVGVSGVNWNVKMMGLKFLDSSGSGSVSDAIEAINYMVSMKTKHSINIVAANNSWGGGGYSKGLYDAVAKARDAGIIFVAAAGNEGVDNDASPSYPASLDLSNVVTVAAIDQNQNLAYFSNYGANTVEIAAPGVSIMSTLPGGGYGNLSGTSMATPHVTGAIALLYSAEPTLSADQAIQRLYSSGVQLSSLSGMVSSGRTLNVGRLINGETSPLPTPTPQPESCPFSISQLGAAANTSADNGTVLFENADEFNFETITLPFSFPFDGRYASQVTVSPNGVLYIGYSPSGMDYDPAQSAPTSSIAALQADIVSTAKISLSNTSATFFWNGYVYASSSAGTVSVRLTINSDGSIQEWVDFSSSAILNLLQAKATIGVGGRNGSNYTYVSPSSSRSLAGSMALQYIPSCQSSDSQPNNDNSLKAKSIKLVAKDSSGKTSNVLLPGKSFRIKVAAASAQANSTRVSSLNFYLNGRLCNETAPVELRSGSVTKAARLPSSTGSNFRKLTIRLETIKTSGKINSTRSLKKSAASFSAVCRALANSVK